MGVVLSHHGNVGARLIHVGTRLYSNERIRERESGKTKRQRNRERHQHRTHYRKEGRQVPASPPFIPAAIPPTSRASAPAARGETTGPLSACCDRGVIGEATAPRSTSPASSSSKRTASSSETPWAPPWFHASGRIPWRESPQGGQQSATEHQVIQEGHVF